MATQAVFSLARPMHLGAQALMVASIAYALKAFVAWPVALLVAVILTYVMSQLLHKAIQAALARCFGLMLMALLPLGAVFATTTAMTYATLYAGVFATPSAILDFTTRREPLERQLQAMLDLATTAHDAMAAWAQDTAAKAQREAASGGTCPNRPQTQGIRGPVAMWREQDATIANALVAEMKARVDAARTAVVQLSTLPKPTDFAEVKAGMALANQAVDTAGRLAGSGGFATTTVAALDERQGSAIEQPAADPLPCGDSARLALIQRAAGALKGLADTPTLARMAATVDLADPHDVATRAWLRGFNGALAIATLGRAGNFSDDALMTHALKHHGVINRETLAFALASTAEACLALTALLLARSGRPPFGGNLVSSLRAAQTQVNAGPARRAMLALGRQVADYLYVEPARANPGGLPTDFGEVNLADNPHIRAQEQGWLPVLQRYHFNDSLSDLLVLPALPQTERERQMAAALQAQQLLARLSGQATAQQVATLSPVVAPRLEQALGGAWQQAQYEVFEVRHPALAQLLRLHAIGPVQGPAGNAATAPKAAEPATGPAAGPACAHTSLRRRLAAWPHHRSAG